MIERDRVVEQREGTREELTQQIVDLTHEIGEIRGKLSIIEADRKPTAYWQEYWQRRIAVVIAVALVIILVVVRGG